MSRRSVEGSAAATAAASTSCRFFDKTFHLRWSVSSGSLVSFSEFLVKEEALEDGVRGERED